MGDMHDIVTIDNRLQIVFEDLHLKYGNRMQEEVAHPLGNVPEGKLESLNALQAQFTNDPRPDKADLMCGVYQTQEGNPYVLPSVKLARQMLFDDPEWEHEYPASHLGEAPFRDMSARLLFGETSQIIKEKRIASMQTLGGSGACHMGARFLRMHYEPYQSNVRGKVYIPSETWVNHPNVFQAAGFETASLPYYDSSTHAFNFNGLDEALRQIPSQSIIVLQVCGNNPTGCDPSAEEWQCLAQTFLTKQHLAFLDLSYPGFVSGSVAEDCMPIRLFTEVGVPLLLATTYGKAFGLYGERVGHLCVPLPTAQAAARVEQQMKLMAREETGAQPRFGAKLVANILGSPRLKMVWEEDLRGLAQDLAARRESLKRELIKQNAPGEWGFVTSQVGMFLYTSFDPEQIIQLREEYAVYLQDTGRLSIAGLNAQNTAHVAESIAKVLGWHKH
ncbi:PLP-dependent transferase [Dothidotthia symphoricarpi CBS 119687]|uniref:PLP-dependent transferase n=1 Tax=Dothidotthia symphoricarpi CBS 119687 TaxID=1392245 RepID=A0A6A6A4T1_9PLEO|nr:PLP-dependent transferase [Dothidotthia symphoricarpi CBS 119687]KAF2126173.1 PLP-dependent transferase [Dothidotthia symphoricarpi CBS 119687]